DDVPDFAHDPVVRAPDLCPDDLVRPQAGSKLVDGDERLGVLLVAMAYGRAAPDLGLPRPDLLVGLVLVVAAQGRHRRPGDEFADVRQQALAILVTAVGP